MSEAGLRCDVQTRSALDTRVSDNDGGGSIHRRRVLPAYNRRTPRVLVPEEVVTVLGAM